MYLNDDNLVFCTLAIGEVARQKVHLQIQSILKFTHNKLILYTDDAPSFGNYYGERIKVIQFEETMTKLGLKGAIGQFQYSLKLVPIRETNNRFGPPIIIWMDSDTFLLGWDRSFDRYFYDKPAGLYARMRGPIAETLSDPVLLKKVTDLGYDPLTIPTHVPIEAVMIWVNTAPHQLNNLMNTWETMALETYNKEVRSDYESVELAISMHKIHFPYTVIDGTFPGTDNFRILHYEKIIQLFV